MASTAQSTGKDLVEAACPLPDKWPASRGRSDGAGCTRRALTPIHALDGRQIGTLEDFWRVIGEVINGPGGCLGRNLEAFADCLTGGLGAPDDEDRVGEWREHQVLRQRLGHSETARQLEIRAVTLSSHRSPFCGRRSCRRTRARPPRHSIHRSSSRMLSGSRMPAPLRTTITS
ncbi:barstar family protein [Streptomyces rishiriensis]|uniref:barstar family protein n=1 Tax=Streptomyces rishiriensis TaxID=68264 RepID=UPI0027D78492|nr:barstar family protein [Streptomyces rishiriensis]